jgi:hypothetical protein
MKLKIGMLLICLFAIAGLALAQAKVDGKWTAEVAGRGGNTQMVTFTFKTEGGKVTGTYAGGGRGGEVPLEDVALSGNMLTFKRKQMGRGGGPETVINYTGTVSGDEIKFKQEVEGRGGMPVEFTAKKAS